MVRNEIEEYRQRLVEILKVEEQTKRFEALQGLANEVGASTQGLSMWGDSDRVGVREGNLVANIHNALQTATMIDMCKTANRNFVIALIATLIALGSVVAVWISVCK